MSPFGYITHVCNDDFPSFLPASPENLVFQIAEEGWRCHFPLWLNPRGSLLMGRGTLSSRGPPSLETWAHSTNSSSSTLSTCPAFPLVQLQEHIQA